MVLEKNIPYICTSAGSNVATASIMATNDMPIRQTPNFEVLGLVNFQLNPHYVEPDPNSHHRGETRERRIEEYLVFNDLPVVALREGSMLQFEGNRMELKGVIDARVFSKGNTPLEYTPGSDLSQYL